MKHNPSLLLKSHCLLVFLLGWLALAACETEPGCIDDNTNLIRVRYLQIDDTSRRTDYTSYLEGIVDVGLVGSDPNTEGGTTFLDALPLNPSQNTTTILLLLTDGTVDTLVIDYHREQILVSPDCGPTQRFIVDSVRSSITSFDSVQIVDPTLERSTPLNLELYICQDTFYTQEVRFNFQEREADTTIIRTDSLFVQTITDETGRVLLANDTVVGSLTLPINTASASTTFTFDLLANGNEPARTETLALVYQDTLTQFARTCAVQTRYFGLDTLSAGTTFDSVRFENRELAIDVPLNIEIVDVLE